MAHEQPNIEMSLREHLLAAGAGQSSGSVPIHQSHPSGSHIDPAIAGPGAYAAMSAGDSGGEDGLDAEGRKGRRELSTSKRAAQNRAAQRAFRQRKEEYIKTLKDKVDQLEAMSDSYKTIQAENYQLRDYIINLQSRLLETHTEFPQPPPNIDLSAPHPSPNAQLHAEATSSRSQAATRSPQNQQREAPTAQMSDSAVSQLQAAAVQAASAGGMRNGKHERPRADYAYPSGKRQKSADDEGNAADDSSP